MTDLDQLDLFPMAPIIEPHRVVGATLDEQFTAFDTANPWVLQALEALVAEQVARDYKRIGVKALVEVLRWRHGRTYGDRWKLNNSLTSRFARRLIELHPEWSALIETRALASERAA